MLKMIGDHRNLGPNFKIIHEFLEDPSPSLSDTTTHVLQACRLFYHLLRVRYSHLPCRTLHMMYDLGQIFLDG